MQIGLVRRALAAAVGTAVSGIEAYGFMPDGPQPPCFAVGGARLTDARMTMRGKQMWVLETYVFTGTSDDDEGQAALDGYLAETGSGSVLAALYGMRATTAARPLGGLVDTLTVDGVDGYRKYPFGAHDLYGALIEVRVAG